VYTAGYVQLQVPTVSIMKGSSTGDIPIYLLKAPEIRVVVDFKTELIPAPLPRDFWSYYFRIHAYDANGTLVAGNITAVPQQTYGTYSQYPWLGNLNPAQPNGVQTWVFQLFGFDSFTTVTNTYNWARRSGPIIGDPNAYDVGPAAGDVGPYGSFSNFGQFWKYNPGTGTLYNGYGLMWGKTYTIVVTEENQIGYIQLATVTATPTCQGITTVVFEMDRMARIAGFAYSRNWMGDFRATSWTTVTAKGATATTKTWGPFDGLWYTYVKPDTYTVTAAGPGLKSASRTVVATWGSEAGGQDFYLEESGIPIPEFPAAGLLAMISALAASLYLLRWKKQTVLPVR
jgi:hypothetical protein